MAQEVEPKQPTPDWVECRPTGNGYGLALLMGLVTGVTIFAGVYRPPRDATEQLAFWLLVTFLCLFTVSAAVWEFRSRIVADAVGLQWRNLGPWRSAAWSEVDDFYLQPLYPPPNAQSVYLVHTSSGVLRIAPSGWTNLEELRRIIAAKAPNLDLEGWAPLGGRARDGDTSLFPYDSMIARAQAVGFLAAGLGVVASYLLFLATESAQVHGRNLAETLPAGLVLLVFAAVGLPFVWLGCSLAWQWWRRREEVIAVTPEALVCRNGAQQQSIPWDQVVEYGYDRERFCKVDAFVRSVAGEEIRMQPFLPRRAQLQAMIQRLAIHSETRVWRYPEAERLGGSRLRERDGARVFHYRTRTNRAMLWFGATFALVVWTPMVQIALGIQPDNGGFHLLEILILAAGTDLAFLWAVLCYYRSAILIDERGLVRETPLGRKCLAWADVREIGGQASWPGKRWYMRGSGVEIRFESQITDLEELQREITTRAPQAEGSWPISDESLPVTTS